MYTLVRDMKMSLPVPLWGRFSNIGKATDSIGIGFRECYDILNAIKTQVYESRIYNPLSFKDITSIN